MTPSQKQSLKGIAQSKNTTNPSQLGDPVSLKAETSDNEPTEHDRPNKSGDTRSLKDVAREKMKVNPSQLGDPVSLKAETSNNEPTEHDRGALGTSQSSDIYGNKDGDTYMNGSQTWESESDSSSAEFDKVRVNAGTLGSSGSKPKYKIQPSVNPRVSIDLTLQRQAITPRKDRLFNSAKMPPDWLNSMEDLLANPNDVFPILERSSPESPGKEAENSSSMKTPAVKDLLTPAKTATEGSHPAKVALAQTSFKRLSLVPEMPASSDGDIEGNATNLPIDADIGKLQSSLPQVERGIKSDKRESSPVPSAGTKQQKSHVTRPAMIQGRYLTRHKERVEAADEEEVKHARGRWTRSKEFEGVEGTKMAQPNLPRRSLRRNEPEVDKKQEQPIASHSSTRPKNKSQIPRAIGKHKTMAARAATLRNARAKKHGSGGNPQSTSEGKQEPMKTGAGRRRKLAWVKIPVNEHDED